MAREIGREVVEIETADTRPGARTARAAVGQAPGERERRQGRDGGANAAGGDKRPAGPRGTPGRVPAGDLDHHAAPVGAEGLEECREKAHGPGEGGQGRQDAKAHGEAGEGEPAVEERQLEAGKELGGDARPVALDQEIQVRRLAEGGEAAAEAGEFALVGETPAGRGLQPPSRNTRTG